MKLTKRSHTNPCFWTALWNKEHYNSLISASERSTPARDRVVYVLNARANKVLLDKVSNIHVEKGISVAEITPEDAKKFCKRWHPKLYNKFCNDISANPEIVYLDIEHMLTSFEELPHYQAVLDVAKLGYCRSREERLEIATFIVFHFFRSSAILQSSIEISRLYGRPKFEYFWWLKQMLSNPDRLYDLTSPIILSQWHMYACDTPAFALPDTPILVGPHSIMIALSPHLLLEIQSKQETTIDRCYTHTSLHKSKLREYRRRAIGNTYKELICTTAEIAEEYQNTYDWKARTTQISNSKTHAIYLQRPTPLKWASCGHSCL